MKKILFRGIATALYTPITKGQIDYEELEALIATQIRSGISALVLLGTTGEGSTVTPEERKKIIPFAVRRTGKKIPLLVGTGSNSTSVAVSMTEEAKSLGADGALVVTPYYNRCTQEGLYEHYRAIARVGLPFLMYNVPSRTTVNIEGETAVRLARIGNVVGLKEASSDLTDVEKKLRLLDGKLSVYSGNDELNLWFFARGAAGAISVASNIKPEEITDIYMNFKNNSISVANRENEKLAPLYKALFREVNPIPLKAAISLLRGRGGETRLPLTPAKAETKAYFQSILHTTNNGDKA